MVLVGKRVYLDGHASGRDEFRAIGKETGSQASDNISLEIFTKSKTHGQKYFLGLFFEVQQLLTCLKMKLMLKKERLNEKIKIL